MASLKSRCNLCGGLGPSTPEHVIPQWVLHEAEHPVDVENSLWHATIRACKKCNHERGSQFESRAKTVFQRLRGNLPLGPSDVSDLLDWLDFLRVKIWLYSLQFDNETYAFEPKYRAFERVGRTDRIAFVGVADLFQRRVCFLPFRDPVFNALPAFCLLVINGVFFVSASMSGIAARAMHLPFLEEVQMREDGQIVCRLAKPSECPDNQRWIARHCGMSVLCQAIWPKAMLPDDLAHVAPNLILPEGDRSRILYALAGAQRRLGILGAMDTLTIPLIDPVEATSQERALSVLMECRLNLARLMPRGARDDVTGEYEHLLELAHAGLASLQPTLRPEPPVFGQHGFAFSVPGMTAFSSDYAARLCTACWQDDRLSYRTVRGCND